MARVKGTKILSKLDYVREALGAEAEERVVAMLPEADRDEVRNLLVGGWYPQELYHRVLEAIGDVSGGVGNIYERIGEYSAEHLVRRIYTRLMTGDPREILDNMAPLHGMLNDPGAMHVVFDEPERCTIQVTAPRSHPAVCAIARAFYRRAVELCGAEQVSVEEPSCSGNAAAHCRFEIAWQPAARADGERSADGDASEVSV